jgi:hypothetical protein
LFSRTKGLGKHGETAHHVLVQAIHAGDIPLIRFGKIPVKVFGFKQDLAHIPMSIMSRRKNCNPGKKEPGVFLVNKKPYNPSPLVSIGLFGN